jgi:hypothetical protein
LADGVEELNFLEDGSVFLRECFHESGEVFCGFIEGCLVECFLFVEIGDELELFLDDLVLVFLQGFYLVLFFLVF